MRKRTRNSGFLLLTLATFFLSACNNLSTTQTSPAIQGLSSTMVAKTMFADTDLIFLVHTPTPLPPRYTPTRSSAYSPSSSRVTMPAATSTPLPTLTLVPSLTPTEILSDTNGLNSTPVECTNAAEFVLDLTIPDDTVMKPGNKFTKTWRLRNIGTCSWTPDYVLVLVTGDQMEGESPKKLQTTVDPGQTVDLSIDLVAPDKVNYYQGNWMLQDEAGNNFGTGSDASHPIWVSIKVYLPGWRDIFQGVSGGNGGEGGCFGGG